MKTNFSQSATMELMSEMYHDQVESYLLLETPKITKDFAEFP